MWFFFLNKKIKASKNIFDEKNRQLLEEVENEEEEEKNGLRSELIIGPEFLQVEAKAADVAETKCLRFLP